MKGPIQFPVCLQTPLLGYFGWGVLSSATSSAAMPAMIPFLLGGMATFGGLFAVCHHLSYRPGHVQLRGAHVVITGGSSGIGLALAALCLKEVHPSFNIAQLLSWFAKTTARSPKSSFKFPQSRGGGHGGGLPMESGLGTLGSKKSKAKSKGVWDAIGGGGMVIGGYPFLQYNHFDANNGSKIFIKNCIKMISFAFIFKAIFSKSEFY